VAIIHRAAISSASDPDKEKARLVQEYTDTFATPFKAAELGFVDEIIQPEETRWKLIQALEMLKNKRDRMPRKKHGNIPL
jgi:propionyl-CoA carboxylase beta chain